MKKKALIWSSLLLIMMLGFGLLSGCGTTSISSDGSTSAAVGTNIVTGTVLDPNGTLASGVSIYTYVATAGLGKLTTQAGDGTLIQATTNQSGHYSLTGFYAGRSYILIAYSSTYGLTYHPIVTSSTEGGSTVANINLANNSGGSSANAAPVVTITTPASDITIIDTQYAISGTVSDTSVTRVIIDVNGSQSHVNVNNGSFTYTVILRNGVNTITVRASNAAGTGTASRTITSQASNNANVMAIKATLTWDTIQDIDLHMYKFASGVTASVWHCYYSRKDVFPELPDGSGVSGNLDVDKVSEGYGPENIRVKNPSPNAIYRIAVGHYDSSSVVTTTNCTLRLALNEGTSAAVVYTYGPFPLRYVSGADSNDYVATDPAGRWWRPIDVQVNASGIASIVTASDSGLTYVHKGMITESVGK